MPSGCLPPAISEALSQGVLVLTPNQRIAQTLRRAFDATQTATTWSPPAIQPLETWLSSLWSHLLLYGSAQSVLLNRTQEHALWKSFIAADLARDAALASLQPIDSLAELAARAWRLLHLYGGDLHHSDFALLDDTRAFQRWARQFDRQGRRDLYLSSAELPGALLPVLAAGDLPVPDAGLLLVDFDWHPPAHATLLDQIRQAGYGVASLQTAAAPANSAARLYAAPDPASELESAAEWARTLLSEDPGARIAVVVPDLDARRAEIDRIFGQTIAPETQPITAATAAPYEFSLGVSLGAMPLAATALDLILWTLEPLPTPRITALLLSPFFTPAESLTAAARFDADVLRDEQLLRPELSLAGTIRLLAGSPRAGSLTPMLARLRALERETPAEESQSYGALAERFRTLLDASGWAALTQSGSLDLEARRRWESALDDLATLDFDGAPSGPRVKPMDALRTLRRIVAQTIFASPNRNAPIQILGPLELGGVPFDALWFLSADDQTWPAAPPLNPFMPRRLANTLSLPGSDPERDLGAARGLTRRIAACATEAIFSYAQPLEDLRRHPSALVRELNPRSWVPQDHAQRYRGAGRLEVYADAAPLPALPDRVIRGGERILKDQAACAFRAFAEHRLRAAAPETRYAGLDSRDRGSLVHGILQDFWSDIHDQATLRGMPPLARQSALGDAIDRGLESPARNIRSPWDAAYLNVERRRLLELLIPWLKVELDRPPFHVQQQEQALPDAHIGALRISLRVDRVDDTEGGPLILDYKTGVAQPSEWLTDRPDSPQLPLYAVLAPYEQIGGIAFAQLRAGDELDLKGYAAHPNTVLTKPVKGDLPLDRQREEWRRVLTGLAEAFAAGDATVAPKIYPKTCRYCAQRVLCRLDLETLPAEDDLEPNYG